MEDFRGVEPQQIADGRDRRAEDDEQDEERDEYQDDRGEGDRGTEHDPPDDLREPDPAPIAEGPSDEADHCDLAEVQGDDRAVLRPNRLHQTDLPGALHDVRGDEIRDGQRGGDEGEDGDEEHEELRLLQDGPLRFGDLPNGPGHGIGHDLFDLVGDGGDVGGAVPGLALGHGQRLRILRRLPRQVVVRGRQGGHLDGADDSGLSEKVLGDGQVRVDAGIGLVARFEDPAHLQLDGAPVPAQGQGITEGEAMRCGVAFTDHRTLGVLVCDPLAGNRPPGPKFVEAGIERLLGLQVEVVIEPGPGERDGLPRGADRVNGQQRGEVEDVVRPEGRLDPAELVLAEEGLLGGPSAVEVLEDRRAARSHDDVRAVGLQLLVDLVPDVEHHREHRRGHGGAEGDRHGDEEVTLAPAGQSPHQHSQEHGVRSSPSWGRRREGSCEDARIRLEDRQRDRQRPVGDLVLDWNGVAAALESDRRDVHRNFAELADDLPVLLVVAGRPADLAGVEADAEGGARLLDDDEADLDPRRGRVGVAVEVAVGDVRDVDDRALLDDGVGLRFGELDFGGADDDAEGDQQRATQVAARRYPGHRLPDAGAGAVEAPLGGVGADSGQGSSLTDDESGDEEEDEHRGDREYGFVVDEPGERGEGLVRHRDDPLRLKDAHDEHDVSEGEDGHDEGGRPGPASTEGDDPPGEGAEGEGEEPAEDVADQGEHRSRREDLDSPREHHDRLGHRRGSRAEEDERQVGAHHEEEGGVEGRARRPARPQRQERNEGDREEDGQGQGPQGDRLPIDGARREGVDEGEDEGGDEPGDDADADGPSPGGSTGSAALARR